MPKRILFHGTTTKFMRPIQKAAKLLPRERTGKAIYAGELESKPDRVYLTDVYAVPFGLIAVRQHGGNLLVARAIVDDATLLPDDDFQDGGKHHLRFTDGQWEECLKQTGCVSTRVPVEIDRLYIVRGKELRDLLADEVHIHTGMMHRALRERMDNYNENTLFFAVQKTFDGEEWAA
jgi:hypothetical protein